jgi:hypothetical protein
MAARDTTGAFTTSGLTIWTITGNGTQCTAPTGSCGDGVDATTANLGLPQGVALDAADNLYVADTGDQKIREITPAGPISTIAGDGTRNRARSRFACVELVAGAGRIRALRLRRR